MRYLLKTIFGLLRYIFQNVVILPSEKQLNIIICNRFHTKSLQIFIPFGVLKLYIHFFLTCDSNPNVIRTIRIKFVFIWKNRFFIFLPNQFFFFCRIYLAFLLHLFNGVFFNIFFRMSIGIHSNSLCTLRIPVFTSDYVKQYHMQTE